MMERWKLDGESPICNASGHPHTRPQDTPLAQRPSTTSPGAIPSSHAERSWGFGATVLVEEKVPSASRVYLGSRRMPKGQASKQEAVIGTRSTDRDSLPWDWSGAHPSLVAAPAWAPVLQAIVTL